MVIQIVEFTASLVEVFLGILVSASLLYDRDIKNRIVLLISVIIALCVWKMNQHQLFSVYTSVFVIACIAAGTSAVCRVNFIDTLIIAIFYMCIIYIIDFLAVTFWGVATGKEDYVSFVSSGFSYERLKFIISSKSILILVSWGVIKKKLGKKLCVSVRRLGFGIAACIVTLWYFIKITYLEINQATFLSWGFLFLIVIFSIHSYGQYMLYIQEKQQMGLASKNMKIQIDAYDKIVQSYLEKQIFYHDLKNHFLIINRYLENEEYDKLKQYMEKLNIKDSEGKWKQRTGIPSVDVLLDYKIKEAEKYGIQVTVDAGLVETEIEAGELVALIGNAVDNAIEACQKVKDGKKWMNVGISQVQEMLLIKVSNPYETASQKKQGNFISTKEDSRMHGLGIQSVKMIVEKHGGKMKIEDSNQIFTIKILFFN